MGNALTRGYVPASSSQLWITSGRNLFVIDRLDPTLSEFLVKLTASVRGVHMRHVTALATVSLSTLR